MVRSFDKHVNDFTRTDYLINILLFSTILINPGFSVLFQHPDENDY